MGRYTDTSSRLGYPYFNHLADHIFHPPGARQTQVDAQRNDLVPAQPDLSETPLRARKAWVKHLLFRRSRTAPAAAVAASTFVSPPDSARGPSKMDEPALGNTAQSETRMPTIVLSFAENRKARRHRSLLSLPIRPPQPAPRDSTFSGDPLAPSVTVDSRPVVAAGGAIPGEVADTLSNTLNVLQRSLVLIAERAKTSQGLSLTDVQRLRTDPCDWSTLPDELDNDVKNAIAEIAQYNGTVFRLEQMAQNEPLDEGWNDLIPGRILDTIRVIDRALAAIEPIHMGQMKLAYPDSPAPAMEGNS
jgi:hypothetical protein